jgi:hypothetical protein
MESMRKAEGKEGKIGRMSCYVLDDGTAVVTKRSMYAVLAGAEDVSTSQVNLERSIERLPNGSALLACAPGFIEFSLPGGGVAHGLTSELVCKITGLYVRGLIEGTLHPKQIPVAFRALENQQLYANVGLKQHILEVTGQQAFRAGQEPSALIVRLLREDPREWSRQYSREFVEAVCTVYRWKVRGNAIPHQMASIFAKLYRLMLGDDVYYELKSRCPEPQKKDCLHQYLADAIAVRLPEITRSIIYIARKAGHGRPKFWRNVQEMLSDSVQVELNLPEAS